VKAIIVVDDRITPKLPAKVIMANHLARRFEQYAQKSQRQSLKLQVSALFAELKGGCVELEQAESDLGSPRNLAGFHTETAHHRVAN
jgi:hypothetical protein